jgi:hypothetical protein
MSFKRLDPEDFIVSSDSIVSTAWSTGAPTLAAVFTSSAQENGASGDFYLEVYQAATSSINSAVQFNIAYCDAKGSGSALYNSLIDGKSPTSTNYGQYRTMILEDENSSFVFGDGTNSITSSMFWAISVERACYKEAFFPGSLNLVLSGSGNAIHLTDNSATQNIETFIGATRVYQLISGSKGNSYDGSSTGYVNNSGSYGLVFPDLGTILINPYAVSQSIGLFPSQSYNSPGLNERRLFNAISGSGSAPTCSFQLTAEETITSDYVFVRARNSEFNYSENPSFISGSTGEVIYDNFINSPQTYITTVGLYNDTNELLAVAKLSRPLLKDFTKESLMRIKLDF